MRPAPVQGHEINRLWRRFLRRHDQIAFVFAVGIVGHDHNFPRSDVFEDIVNRVELKRFRRLDDHSDTIAVAPLLGNGN